MNEFESEYPPPQPWPPTYVRNTSVTDTVQDEVTLQKISNLEDDYSKMKAALLDELSPEDDFSPEQLVGGQVDQVRKSRINSQSFLDESSHSNRDLSRTHGKASTVAEFVDAPKLVGPADLKHEDMLARASGQSAHKVYTIPEEDEEAYASNPRAAKGRRACRPAPKHDRPKELTAPTHLWKHLCLRVYFCSACHSSVRHQDWQLNDA